MRTLTSLLAVAAIAAFGLTTPASANKGVDKVKHDHFTSGFSAPFVADGGAEVSPADDLGSKGDLDNDGNWGVVTGELGNTVLYDICLVAEGVGPILLGSATSAANGDLDATGSMDAADEGDYQAPSLQIYQDDADTCGDDGGTLVQESGTTIMIDAD